MANSLLFGFFLLFLTVPTQSDAVPIEITVAFGSGGDIYITDFSGDPVNITHSDTFEMQPIWSPDATQIAFLSSDSYLTWNEAHLYIMKLATGTIRQLSKVDFSSETTLTWSPDGRYIAATLGSFFIVDVDSGKTRELLVDCAASCDPDWLHDNSSMVMELGGEIFKLDANQENFQQLTQSPPNAYRPVLSPSSDDVLFVSSYDDISGLYSINTQTSAVNRVVDLSGYDVIPHYWSPDGEHIAYGVSPAFGSDVLTAGVSDVYVIRPDGTDKHLVTGNGSDSLIGWANDSQHILYYEGKAGDPGGTFVAVHINTGVQTRLSTNAMDEMCSYGNCGPIVIRPE